ncbi:hypothetical protein [Pseudorhizobium banfieldiae]|nr:hypothetical protein [Pseudorhizobium banfieldiae]
MTDPAIVFDRGSAPMFSRRGECGYSWGAKDVVTSNNGNIVCQHDIISD